MLRRRGRVSYRALKRQHDLEDDYLTDLKDEILYTQCLVAEDGERGLVWTGDIVPVSETSRDERPNVISDPIPDPRAYTPLSVPKTRNS